MSHENVGTRSRSLGSYVFRSLMYPPVPSAVPGCSVSICLFIWLSLSCDVWDFFFSGSMGFPGGSVGKEFACSAGHARDSSLIPGLGRSPGGRAWQSTPVFLPGESPRTEEPVRLQSMGLQRVGRD